MSKDNGGAAFPVTASEYGGNGTEYGMTLRDYFAAKAMQALIPACQGMSFGQAPKNDNARLAITSYSIADAMLAERAK
jgi:hypothetical protein